MEAPQVISLLHPDMETLRLTLAMFILGLFWLGVFFQNQVLRQIQRSKRCHHLVNRIIYFDQISRRYLTAYIVPFQIVSVLFPAHTMAYGMAWPFLCACVEICTIAIVIFAISHAVIIASQRFCFVFLQKYGHTKSAHPWALWWVFLFVETIVVEGTAFMLYISPTTQSHVNEAVCMAKRIHQTRRPIQSLWTPHRYAIIGLLALVSLLGLGFYLSISLFLVLKEPLSSINIPNRNTRAGFHARHKHLIAMQASIFLWVVIQVAFIGLGIPFMFHVSVVGEQMLEIGHILLPVSLFTLLSAIQYLPFHSQICLQQQQRQLRRPWSLDQFQDPYKQPSSV